MLSKEFLSNKFIVCNTNADMYNIYKKIHEMGYTCQNHPTWHYLQRALFGGTSALDPHYVKNTPIIMMMCFDYDNREKDIALYFRNLSDFDDYDDWSDFKEMKYSKLFRKEKLIRLSHDCY